MPLGLSTLAWRDFEHIGVISFLGPFKEDVGSKRSHPRPRLNIEGTKVLDKETGVNRQAFLI